MTRIIIQKNGITTDVPESEVAKFYRAGYEKIGTKPDAPTAEEQMLMVSPEEKAVADAQLNLSKAEKELAEEQEKSANKLHVAPDSAAQARADKAAQEKAEKKVVKNAS